MRKLPVFILALLLGLTTLGCDSNEDDETDAEIFIGSWSVVEVSDDEGDKTEVFQQGIDDFSATINADGTFSLTLDFVDPQQPDIPLQGTYVLDEVAKALVLRATLGTGEAQLPFQYDIESEDRIDLEISEQYVEGIFGTAADTYVGNVTFTIERQ